MAANLVPTETITNVVVTLTNLTTREDVALTPPPTSSATTITQQIVGSFLTEETTFLLKTTFTGSITGLTHSNLTLVECGPF